MTNALACGLNVALFEARAQRHHLLSKSGGECTREFRIAFQFVEKNLFWIESNESLSRGNGVAMIGRRKQ
jgi:hypothetical protein